MRNINVNTLFPVYKPFRKNTRNIKLPNVLMRLTRFGVNKESAEINKREHKCTCMLLVDRFQGHYVDDLQKGSHFSLRIRRVPIWCKRTIIRKHVSVFAMIIGDRPYNRPDNETCQQILAKQGKRHVNWMGFEKYSWNKK